MGGDARRQKHRPWRPGESGNPAGRPKGSRNKLSQDFIEETYEVWQEKGMKVLHYMADNEPAKFAQMVANLIPQHFTLEHEHKLAGLSDEELQSRLIEAVEELAKAGITIDLEAKEVVALPSPRHERNTPEKQC